VLKATASLGATALVFGWWVSRTAEAELRGPATPHVPSHFLPTQMSQHPDVYVFVSDDRQLFGLSTNPLGANLPPGDWRRYDVMPMSENYLGRDTVAPQLAMKRLQTRGYFLAKPSGNIIPLPE
jgi:hypothetical protein